VRLARTSSAISGGSQSDLDKLDDKAAANYTGSDSSQVGLEGRYETELHGTGFRRWRPANGRAVRTLRSTLRCQETTCSYRWMLDCRRWQSGRSAAVVAH
jgi:hypothetical protein